MLHPSQVQLEPDDIYRINRARLAITLHKFPSEIDGQPLRDIEELIGVWNIDEATKAREAAKRQ